MKNKSPIVIALCVQISAMAPAAARAAGPHLPAALHCQAPSCTTGLPACASESWGNTMTILSVSSGKPKLTYDWSPGAGTTVGSVRIGFGDSAPITFRFESQSIHASFRFKRADLEALASGAAQSVDGNYQRGQVDEDDPDANGRDPRMALLNVTCSATIPSAAPVASAKPIGDLVASCTSCHGDKGVSTIPGVPNIGGQKLHMLIDELDFYRNGSRTDSTMQVMNAIAEPMPDADIQAIATYYSGMSRPNVAASAQHVTPLPEVARCCGCHSAHGVLASGPWGDIYLTSQSQDTLAAQLVQLRDDARPDFVPRYILSGYTDAELENFAAYFASETEDQVCTDVPVRPDP